MAPRRPLALVSGGLQELPASDVVSINGLDGVQTSAAQTNAVYLTNAGSLAQAPFTVLWHDLLAFNRQFGMPAYTTSVDGSTAFTTDTLNSKIFNGKDAHTPVTIMDGTALKGARWQWNNANIAFSAGAWLVIGHAYGGATSATKQVTIESSADGAAWTTRHTSSYSTDSAPVWHFVTSYGGHTYLRVTIVWTSGGSVKLSSMRLLTARWGDQGGGPELAIPWSWNASGWLGIGQGTTEPTSALQVTGSAVVSGAVTAGGVDLGAGLAGKQDTSAKGAANGYAGLDASTKVPITQLPTGATSSTVPLGDHTHSAITPVSLAYAATLTPDLAAGPSRECTLTGAATLNPPTNPTNGAKWEGRFYASGAIRVLTLGSTLRRPSTIANTVSIPSGLYADVALKYTTTAAEWAVLACQAYS